MKAISLPAAVLVALLLGLASSPGPALSGREVRPALAGQGAPPEEPHSVQEMLQAAWVRSRPTDAQKWVAGTLPVCQPKMVCWIPALHGAQCIRALTPNISENRNK